MAGRSVDEGSAVPVVLRVAAGCIEGVAGGGEMPAFSHSLSNRQVSDLVHYLRARFAPGETPWKDVGRTVAEIRREHNQQP